VLLGLQPLTTTAVTILSSLWLVTSRLHSYLLRVLPANKMAIAGTNNFCPGTRMARSYKHGISALQVNQSDSRHSN
jgi:hypothetical protein